MTKKDNGMEAFLGLIEEEPEFADMLLELVTKLPRIDVARLIKLMQEELDDFLVTRRVA